VFLEQFPAFLERLVLVFLLELQELVEQLTALVKQLAVLLEQLPELLERTVLFLQCLLLLLDLLPVFFSKLLFVCLKWVFLNNFLAAATFQCYSPWFVLKILKIKFKLLKG
jgi:hypothetical protein